jgi:hypothetical protein
MKKIWQNLLLVICILGIITAIIFLIGRVIMKSHIMKSGNYVSMDTSPPCLCTPGGQDAYNPKICEGTPRDNGKLACCNGDASVVDGKWICPCLCTPDGQDAYNPKICGGTPRDNGKLACCNGDASLVDGKWMCGGSPTPTPPPPGGKYTQTFKDTFKDQNNWYSDNSFDSKYTNTCAKYDPKQVTVKDNQMILTVGERVSGKNCGAGKNPPDYCILSGRVTSNYKFKYGICLFDAKVPKGQSLWPALWLTGNQSGGGSWPFVGEIDVMETMYTPSSQPYITSRLMVPSTTNTNNPASAASLPPDGSMGDDGAMTKVDDDFWNSSHVFAVDWELQSDGDVTYKFYLDVKMTPDGLVDKDGNSNPQPYKSHSLKQMTKQYLRSAGSKFYTFIRDSITKNNIVMNIAVANKDGNDCDNLKCSGCGNNTAEMVVKNVEVWQKI